MSGPLFLSRARLKRTAQIKTLLPLLRGSRGFPDHHLVWSLFADEERARGPRDFLWRKSEKGVFYILSRRKPRDPHGLFELDFPKRFEMGLAQGARLRFALRACPVVRRRRASGDRRSSKHDVVMDALRRYPITERAERRSLVAAEQGFAWLRHQAEEGGFDVRKEQVFVDGYRQTKVPRRGAAPMVFATLEFKGILTLRDPDRLIRAIRRGFGAAKAFGCGLMLVRPL